MNSAPTVSIIIPTYNRADMVKGAILSVIGQTSDSWECIVVDDGSTDNTKEVVEGFMSEDGRIRYFSKENGGQGSARNWGIQRAQGEWILPLDSDDALLPEALEIFMREAGRTKTDVVFGMTWRVVRETGKIKGIGNSTPSSTLFRKRLFIEYGLYDTNRNISEDIDHWYMLQYATKPGEVLFSGISYPTSIYFSHTGQVTSLKNSLRLINVAQTMIEKWGSVMPSNHEGRSNMGRWWRNLGTYKILAGDRAGGLKALKMAFRLHHSLEIVILYILALIGTGAFRNTAPRLKELYEETISRKNFIQYAVRHPKRTRFLLREVHKICQMAEGGVR